MKQEQAIQFLVAKLFKLVQTNCFSSLLKSNVKKNWACGCLIQMFAIRTHPAAFLVVADPFLSFR